jgi:predicted MFS family arabinose efflux permease
LIDGVGFNGLFVASAAAGLASWGLVWTFPLLEIRGPGPRRSFFHALAQRNLLPIWWITLSFAAGLETLFTFTRTFVDERQIGSAALFFGVYGLAAAVTRIFGGRSYDRIPQRPLILIAIVSYGLSLVMLGQSQAVPLFMIAAFLGGIGHGAVFPVLSSSVVYRARASERGSAISIFTSIFDVALLLFAPVVGSLIEGFSYTFAFTAMGAFLLVGGFVYSLWDRKMIASGAMSEHPA